VTQIRERSIETTDTAVSVQAKSTGNLHTVIPSQYRIRHHHLLFGGNRLS
jgi:hypothetical protein